MSFTTFDKAIVAAVLAAAGVLGSAQLNAGAVTVPVLVTALVVGILAGAAVFAKANGA